MRVALMVIYDVQNILYFKESKQILFFPFLKIYYHAVTRG